MEQLVTKLAPTKDRRRMTRYAMRIVGSRIEPTHVGDEFHVSSLIKKRLVDAESKGGISRDASGKTAALRYDELFRRLCAAQAVRNTWAVLHLLQNISRLEQPKKFMTDFQSGGLLEAVPTRAVNQNSQTNTGNSAPRGHTNGSNAGVSGPTRRQPRSNLAYGVQPAADLEHKTSFEVSDHVLLRSLLFCFQGIDSEHIYYSPADNCHVIHPNIGVPSATRDLVRMMCELGWLYSKVVSFINRSLEDRSLGLVAQSFCHALREELSDYYRLVAVLESQLNRDSGASSSGEGSSTGSRLTLRRLYVWTQDPLERMRLMAVMVDSVGE
jgi:gamma-tubulin complex component 3